MLAGATLVPVSSSADAETLAFIIGKAVPVAVVVDDACYTRVAAALALAGTPAPLLVRSTYCPPAPQTPQAPQTSSAFGDILGNHAPVSASSVTGEAFLEVRMPEDVGAVLFTSGSTGSPKGALFAEANLVPSGPITTIHPFIRLDFEPFDPTLCLSLLQTVRCGGRRAICSSWCQVSCCFASHISAFDSFICFLFFVRFFQTTW
jgi:acyl-CoA synthetase (AMP-forming)/AMP-acid ligase II